MKLHTISLATTFLLGFIPVACQAQDFSADVVYGTATKTSAPINKSDAAPIHSPKIYVSKDNIRLETGNLSGTVLLVNGEEHSAVALFPARREYQQLGSGPSEYFRVEDPENACPDWQKASAEKIVCDKAGHELVDGREAVKYQNKRAFDGSTDAVWIDPTLKFVIKWEGAGTGAELHNIKVGTQAADLFAMPADYKFRKPQKGSSKGFSPRPR